MSTAQAGIGAQQLIDYAFTHREIAQDALHKANQYRAFNKEWFEQSLAEATANATLAQTEIMLAQWMERGKR